MILDFFSKSDLNLDKYKDPLKYIWFEVGDILDLNSLQKVNKYIVDNNLVKNAYACDTLTKLFSVIHIEKLLNYYLQDDPQDEKDSDKILEIFIRTNSGGTPLSFSDLLMSIASANWKNIDAREEIKKLVDEVYDIGHPGFIINKDFVLRTFLVLFIDDVKFRLKNFTHENVNKFEKNWIKIRKSIISAFTLFESLGFNDKTFRAKNAAIPIIYYIYHNNLEENIINPTYKNRENKEKITKWLILSFIKSVFGGQLDSILKKWELFYQKI
ncbi:hypothetical protein [[Mycoplasma] cavipharyngis]|uniref:hypothetical protein n=1 Tax=[Mycoplasma] cavipharyngis TaxID=92757 RepID=UPI003703B916